MSALLYFDHNATAPVSDAAREAWLRATQEFPGNASSQHRLGKRAEHALEGARERLAELLGSRAEELVWTSGATEGINTVLAHFAAEAPGGEAWVSSIEHPSTLESARRWFTGRVRTIPVIGSGVVDLEWVHSELAQGRRPVVAALIAANNETGVLQPWREVLTSLQQSGAALLCDAAQWLGKLPGEELGACGYVVGCGHKFGGPHGVGFVKAAGGKLRPLIVGGPQEEGRRAGTENLPGVLAFMAALEERLAGAGTGSGVGEARGTMEAAIQERIVWRDEFIARVCATVPGARLIGEGVARLWNTVSLRLPVPDCRVRWVVKLDKAGVAASTGSACASGKEKVSHVLEAMGLTPEEASGVVRFSSGWETTRKQWAELRERVGAIWQELRPK